MGYGGFDEFRRNHETGEVEEWHVGYTSTKGFRRGQSTESYMIRVVPAAEWAEIEAENARITAERTEEKQARITAAEIEAAYFSALPPEIAGFKRGHCGRGWELEDNYGNYVLSIPKTAAAENWPLEKLAEWIDAQTAEGYGE
jgi:hypothetical protein